MQGQIHITLPLPAPLGGGGVACISRAAVSKAAIPNAYISIGWPLNVRSSPHSGAKKCRFLMLSLHVLTLWCMMSGATEPILTKPLCCIKIVSQFRLPCTIGGSHVVCR